MVLATAKTGDFERFWSTFSTKGAEKRKHHGSGGATVFHHPNDEGRVWIVFDWDEEGFQRFVSDPTFRRSSRKPSWRARPRPRSSPESTTPSTLTIHSG